MHFPEIPLSKSSLQKLSNRATTSLRHLNSKSQAQPLFANNTYSDLVNGKIKSVHKPEGQRKQTELMQAQIMIAKMTSELQPSDLKQKASQDIAHLSGRLSLNPKSSAAAKQVDERQGNL